MAELGAIAEIGLYSDVPPMSSGADYVVTAGLEQSTYYDGETYWPVPQPTGNYRVFGVLTEDGLPVVAPLFLYDSLNMNTLLASTVSGPDGSYQFSNLPAGQYLVVARDPNKAWNAVCRDHVNATLM
jgi:hypothetical protein